MAHINATNDGRGNANSTCFGLNENTIRKVCGLHQLDTSVLASWNRNMTCLGSWRSLDSATTEHLSGHIVRQSTAPLHIIRVAGGCNTVPSCSERRRGWWQAAPTAELGERAAASAGWCTAEAASTGRYTAEAASAGRYTAEAASAGRYTTETVYDRGHLPLHEDRQLTQEPSSCSEQPLVPNW